MIIKKVNSNTKNLNLSKTGDDEICKIKVAYCHDKFPLEKLGPNGEKVIISIYYGLIKTTYHIQGN